MSTVALSMIVKDEYSQVKYILDTAVRFFDEINVVVSDKPTRNKLSKTVLHPNVKFKYREWNNRFDEARNVAMKMCTTDYMFWLDADDSFDFSAIPQLVKIADDNNIDAIFLPYNYMQDERGVSVTRHWRERLIRLNKGYEWRGWVHETCISDEPVRTHMVDFEVKHNTTLQDSINSHGRNHKILLEAYEATEDPRYQHYLAMSLFTKKEYELAGQLFADFINKSQNVEDIYRSFCLMSECAYFLGKHGQATEYALKASVLKPEYPMAYWLLAQYEDDQENYKEALEWVRVSETKPDPETLVVWDPSSRERATLLAAKALYMLGRYNHALRELQKIPNSTEADKIYDDFLHEADIETFVNLLPKMRKFFRSDIELWQSLTDELKYDKRLRALRESVTAPKIWDEKTIVIFCGPGYEEWGPHTLDKGMGGSEEAVVYLSKELARLGWNVTVFAEADLIDGNYNADGSVHGFTVKWLPWQQMDRRDRFNVFISWRTPVGLQDINAKVKLADIHDVLPEEVMKNIPDVTYMVKTKYHRNLSPHLTDDKFRIIGNGIPKDHFNEDSK